MQLNQDKVTNRIIYVLSWSTVLVTKIYVIKDYQEWVTKNFPGSTYQLIKDHLPDSPATDKGHMIQKQARVQFTRNQQKEILDARREVNDMNPPQEACPAIEDNMFCFAMSADQNEGTVYSNLTGKFPVQSFEGYLYLFVCYVYSKNAIIMQPMKDWTDDCMVKTFQDVYKILNQQNCAPKLHVLDNKCSKAVQAFIQNKQTNIQLVEPHNHWVNAAETAIKASKYQIIAGLQTADPDYPLQLWSKFIAQMQDTLNSF